MKGYWALWVYRLDSPDALVGPLPVLQAPGILEVYL